jgi:hypothetical protein
VWHCAPISHSTIFQHNLHQPVNTYYNVMIRGDDKLYKRLCRWELTVPTKYIYFWLHSMVTVL